MASFSSVVAATCRRPKAGEELECYSKERPTFAALRTTRGLRKRIMPPRRASSRERCTKGSLALMAESKLMLKKNQTWLSLEDLTAPPPSPEVELTHPLTKSIDRRFGRMLNTIPDASPATLTQGLPQATPDTHTILHLPHAQVTPPVSPSSASSFFQEQERDSTLILTCSYMLESSGTLTPSSEATLSRGPSVEMLSSSPSSGDDASHYKSSPSFTMCRGDSVDGLFISALPVSSPLEPEEVTSLPSLAQQSPFRRQLFTSLVTRQSALVTRVANHSRSLGHMVDTVTRLTTRTNTPSPPLQDLPPPTSEAHAPHEPWAVGEVEGEDEPGVLPFHGRLAQRLQSICDSGLGFDTDDDLASLSRSSTYTTSDDGEEGLDEGKQACHSPPSPSPSVSWRGGREGL